ncbi:MAG: hypothetical protein GX868_02320 [Actinobacteria bacterium]|nr:hypothetical protein [Actinomycetota bacterium]
MSRRWRAVVSATIAASTLLSACVASQDADLAEPDRTTTTLPAALVGSFGEVYSAGDISVELRGVRSELQTPADRSQIAVEVRSQSRSTVDQPNPHLELRCAGVDNAGTWMAGSTWEPNGVLRSDSVLSGEAILGFPISDANPEYPVLTCDEPTLRMIVRDKRHKDLTVVEFAVEPAIIAESLAAPAGPPLPLPYAGT